MLSNEIAVAQWRPIYKLGTGMRGVPLAIVGSGVSFRRTWLDGAVVACLVCRAACATGELIAVMSTTRAAYHRYSTNRPESGSRCQRRLAPPIIASEERAGAVMGVTSLLSAHSLQSSFETFFKKRPDTLLAASVATGSKPRLGAVSTTASL